MHSAAAAGADELRPCEATDASGFRQLLDAFHHAADRCPALYAMARSRAFHDVTARPASKVAVVRTNYVNSTNASGGTDTLLRTAGDTGTLSSIPGYDDSTGLGTPDGLAFLSALAPHSRTVAAAVRSAGPR
jgi:hypothetical protein